MSNFPILYPFRNIWKRGRVFGLFCFSGIFFKAHARVTHLANSSYFLNLQVFAYWLKPMPKDSGGVYVFTFLWCNATVYRLLEYLPQKLHNCRFYGKNDVSRWRIFWLWSIFWSKRTSMTPYFYFTKWFCLIDLLFTRLGICAQASIVFGSLGGW